MPQNGSAFDAVLLISFGGPLAPRRHPAVPAERVAGTTGAARPRRGGRAALRVVRRRVAAHRDYPAAGGGVARSVSPRSARSLPVFVGMRNWHPFHRRHPGGDGGGGESNGRSASSWRRTTATRAAGSTARTSRRPAEELRARAGAADVEVLFAPGWHTHGRVRGSQRSTDRCRPAAGLPGGVREAARIVFTAHSIPTTMASACRYETDLRETAERVARSPGDRRLGCWPTRAGVGGPRTPGWSRTSASTCAPRTIAACGRRSSLRSGSWPITSRCCTTSTRKRPGSAATSTCRCTARPPSTTTRPSSTRWPT